MRVQPPCWVNFPFKWAPAYSAPAGQQGTCAQQVHLLCHPARHFPNHQVVHGTRALENRIEGTLRRAGLTSAICSQWNAADLAPCSAFSARGRFYGDLWAPFMFTLFNGGDFLGRLLAGVGPWSYRRVALILLNPNF